MMALEILLLTFFIILIVLLLMKMDRDLKANKGS